MRRILSILLFQCLVLAGLTAQASASSPSYLAQQPAVNPYDHIPVFSDKELEVRVKQLVSTVVPPRFTAAVKSYIRSYTVKNREKTATMLGRIAMYFPMYEQYAREKQVPTDLKYLSIVESALDPNAVSRSGAVGLWQFMPATGIDNGLNINRMVDERKDPHKATRAAYRYLAAQYKRYGNWELALAAYNGGPGRVNRAIKRGRSKNFWRISKYLPRETRNYIPAFIGATYIAHYYKDHGIEPVPVEEDLIHTAVTSVFKPYTFIQLEEITGTPAYLISALNPSYKKRLIPYNRAGNNLVLPQASMVRFLEFVGRPDHQLEQLVASRVPAPDHINRDDVALISHEVEAGEDLQHIADLYNCSTDDLIQWNKLTTSQLNAGQRLMLFLEKRPTEQLKYQQIENLGSLEKRSLNQPEAQYSIPAGLIPQVSAPGKFGTAQPDGQNEYVFYRLKKRETLMDVVAKHPDVTLEQLMELNGLDRFSKIKPGKKIKVKPK